MTDPQSALEPGDKYPHCVTCKKVLEDCGCDGFQGSFIPTVEPGDLGPWLEKARTVIAAFRKWALDDEPDREPEHTEEEATVELERRIALALKGAATEALEGVARASCWGCGGKWSSYDVQPVRTDHERWWHLTKGKTLDNDAWPNQCMAEGVQDGLAAIRSGSKPEEGA